LIRAIILDLDNTLTDFMKMKGAALDAALDGMVDAGLPVSREVLREHIWRVYNERGHRVPAGVRSGAHGRRGVDRPARARGGNRGLSPHARIHARHVSARAVHAARLLKRGLKLAVVSDAPRNQVWLRLASLQLHNLFDVVVTFDDTQARKPSPEPFRRALERLGIGPTRR
jgi:putative hydrolase of the HAD superfamily